MTTQLVWVQLPGYPPWPAVIDDPVLAGQKSEAKRKCNQGRAFVRFYGDDSHAFVPWSRIEDFEEQYQKNMCKSKSKVFLAAVAKARSQAVAEIHLDSLDSETATEPSSDFAEVEQFEHLEHALSNGINEPPDEAQLPSDASSDQPKRGRPSEDPTSTGKRSRVKPEPNAKPNSLPKRPCVAIKTEPIDPKPDPEPIDPQAVTPDLVKGKGKGKRALESEEDTPVKPSIASTRETSVGETSTYELERLAKMRRNEEVLRSLDLPTMPVTVTPSRPVRGLGPTRRRSSPIERRSSLRIQGKTPDGTELPPDFREPPMGFAPASSCWDRERVKGDVPLIADDKIDTEDKDRSAKEVARIARNKTASDRLVKLLSSVPAAALDAKRTPNTKNKSKAQTQHWAHSLSLAESATGKVTPERIFSVALFPLPSLSLVAAGDKQGSLGVFNPDVDDDAVVALYKIHSRPVHSLIWEAEAPHKLYSASYDGSVRVMDIERGSFVETWADPDQDRSLFSMCRGWTPHTFFTAHDDGKVALRDLRVAGSCVEEWGLHEGRLSDVHSSPTDNFTLATSSADRLACVWDVRRCMHVVTSPVAPCTSCMG